MFAFKVCIRRTPAHAMLHKVCSYMYVPVCVLCLLVKVCTVWMFVISLYLLMECVLCVCLYFAFIEGSVHVCCVHLSILSTYMRSRFVFKNSCCNARLSTI